MNRIAVASELLKVARLLHAYGEDPVRYAEDRAKAIAGLERANLELAKISSLSVPEYEDASMFLDDASYAVGDLDFHGGEKVKRQAQTIKKKLDMLLKNFKKRRGTLALFRSRFHSAEDAYRRTVENAQTEVGVLLEGIRKLPETIDMPVGLP